MTFYDAMLVYLAIITPIAGACVLAYLVTYALIANRRDPIAVNAWLGGAAALCLITACGAFVLGDNPGGALAACVGFTLVAIVWAWRAVLVVHTRRDYRNRK